MTTLFIIILLIASAIGLGWSIKKLWFTFFKPDALEFDDVITNKQFIQAGQRLSYLFSLRYNYDRYLPFDVEVDDYDPLTVWVDLDDEWKVIKVIATDENGKERDVTDLWAKGMTNYLDD